MRKDNIIVTVTDLSTSIIIVTYNVAGFIAFCIDSILKSELQGKYEIIIVDNNSSDHSVQFIQENYPDLRIIQNDTNLGFSKACNQGADIATGSVLLFLNPDCIVDESAISLLSRKAWEKGIGLVGPQLIDGSGHTLPESARELPTTLSGINKIFKLPFHDRFPYYKYISGESDIGSPVLCGACIAVKQSNFLELERFDERFFMYGEDVDLSVRSLNAGLTNICLPKARVVHFKGESTDKNQLHNNYNFYNAIKIYINKHHGDSKLGSKRVGLGLFASSFSKLKYITKRLKYSWSILVDFIIVCSCLWLLQFLWSYIKIGSFYYYGFYQYVLQYVVYAVVWISILYFNGVYFGTNIKSSKVFKGALFGGLAVLLIYALLPEVMRFSRMIIVLSIFIVPIVLSLRYLLATPSNGTSYFVSNHEFDPIVQSSKEHVLIDNCNEVTIRIKKNDQVIFDFMDLKVSDMINLMTSRENNKPLFKFWHRKIDILFSSEYSSKMGISRQGIDQYHLTQRSFLLQKRIFDLITITLLYIPFALMSGLKISQMNEIIKGHKTIVGYSDKEMGSTILPVILPALITCYNPNLIIEEKQKVAIDYAANYTIFDDVFIMLTQFKYLTKVLLKDN